MAQSAAVARSNVDPQAQTAPKKTVLGMFHDTVARQPNATAARIKVQGVYQPTTWAEMAKQAREISLGLMSLGVQPEERVCILAGTRLEWVTSDLGVLGTAAVTVPIYQSNPAPDCAYIVENCGAVAIFVEDE